MDQKPYTVTLPDWEGPLDLLLHVIRSHELDILNIPIAFVTEQYLNYIEVMRSMSFDVAAEYLEMAATLAYIKSRMLLPKESSGEDEQDDDELDPREELVRRLLEYQRYKDAASQLSDRALLGRDTFPPAKETIVVEGEDQPLLELGVFDLLEAFRHILVRTKVDLSHEVMTERVSVAERIQEITSLLRPGVLCPFDTLLHQDGSRLDVVVTFLALLEMTKLRMTRLFQASEGGQIYVALSGWTGKGQLVYGMAPEGRGLKATRWRTQSPGKRQREQKGSRTLSLLRRFRSKTKERRTLPRPRGPLAIHRGAATRKSGARRLTARSQPSSPIKTRGTRARRRRMLRQSRTRILLRQGMTALRKAAARLRKSKMVRTMPPRRTAKRSHPTTTRRSRPLRRRPSVTRTNRTRRTKIRRRSHRRRGRAKR